MKKEFKFGLMPANLKLSVTACTVQLIEAPDGIMLLKAEVDGEEDDTDPVLKEIIVSQDGNDISIKYEAKGNSITHQGSGNNIFGNKNVTNYYSNGDLVASHTTVDGKIVTQSGRNERKPRITKITIALPERSTLKAELNGAARLLSGLQLGATRLEISGASRAILGTVSGLEAEVSGASRLSTKVGNDVKVDCSGASTVSLEGWFASVSAEASGASNIETKGKCVGNYKAEASGASNIRHTGEVQGRVSRDASGASDIRIS